MHCILDFVFFKESTKIRFENIECNFCFRTTIQKYENKHIFHGKCTKSQLNECQ